MSSRIASYVRRHHLALIALFFALGGGTSFAVSRAFQASAGVYHGCANRQTGALRLVAAGKKCGKKDQEVSWNQTGPKGDPGQPGAVGQAGGSGPPGPPGPAATTLWASVRSDGTLVASSGVVSISGGPQPGSSVGPIGVVFNRDVSRCARLATLGTPYTLGGSGNSPGQVFTDSGAEGNPGQVDIYTYTSSGAAQYRSFFIGVFC